MVRRQTSNATSPRVSSGAMPALVTSRSTGPSPRSVSPTIRATSSGSDTSACTI